MERIVRLFMNNRSQAVRIPKEFELPGDEVVISRRSDGSLVLRPNVRLDALLATLPPLAAEDRLDDLPELRVEDIDL